MHVTGIEASRSSFCRGGLGSSRALNAVVRPDLLPHAQTESTDSWQATAKKARVWVRLTALAGRLDRISHLIGLDALQRRRPFPEFFQHRLARGGGFRLFLASSRAFAQRQSFPDDANDEILFVLADGETAGPAEAIAADLRLHTKALLIGQTTAGRAVEYSDLPLNGGRILRAAVSEAVLPEGRALFPEGVKANLPVEMSTAEKHAIFQQSRQSGMSQFVFENERPHLNEAALLAGRNPELDTIEASQRRDRKSEKAPPRDLVLQRAVDVVTSLSIYQQR